MEQGAKKEINVSKIDINIFQKFGIFFVLIIFCILGAILSPYFLKINNLINIIRQISIVGVVSIGMTFVILTSGIDLSVGAILGAVAVVSASVLKSGGSVLIAVIIGLALGILLGAINGLGVTFGKIPPFIMTLGTMVAARGFAMLWANGSPVSWSKTDTEFTWLGSGYLLKIPTPVWVFGIIFITAVTVLKYTRFGRYVYAFGDSPEAARLSGINTSFVQFMVYTISGLACAISALIYISRLDVGQPTSGTGLELDAIAMVVIGGTSVNGGEGGVVGTLIGAAIIAVLGNVLNLLGISPFIQQIVTGIIIVLAILMQRKNK